MYTNFWQAFLKSISPADVLLLEKETLYESYGLRILGGEDPSGFWAPGKAAQNQKDRRSEHFSENLMKILIFGVHAKTYSAVQIFL